MRRLFSILWLIALLTGQVSPAACILAPAQDAAVAAHTDLQDSAGTSDHVRQASQVHAHHGQHSASAGTSAPEAGRHGASSPVPVEHEDSCMELMRCHWAAVPGSDMSPLVVRATAAEPLIQPRRALASAAAALLTPPPRSHS